jgi:hypothetical protein
MAYQPEEGENFGIHSMSYILISVKNKMTGNENLRDSFMSTANVEGKSAGESSPKDNHYLGLKRLKFVFGTEECWVKQTEATPIVAMVLSMGDTERTEKLVVAEEPSVSYLNPEFSDSEATNADRIVFGIRGFKATYRFPTSRIQNAMTDIVIRHDVSGEFPESRPTNAVERDLFDQAQRVDGDFHGAIELTEEALLDIARQEKKKKQDLGETTGNPSPESRKYGFPPSNDDDAP